MPRLSTYGMLFHPAGGLVTAMVTLVYAGRARRLQRVQSTDAA